MNTLTKLTDQAKRLVDQYGPEVSICARVAVATLLPAGAVIAESVGGLCEYVSDRRLEKSNQKILEILGDLSADQEQISRVFDVLLKQLNPLMEQLMETQKTKGLDSDQILGLMKRQCLTSLSTQEEVATIQSELMKMQPELSYIKDKSAALLSAQENSSKEIKEAISQVRTLVDTMYSYSVPLNPQELNTSQRKDFYHLHALFQDQFLSNETEAMEDTISSMKDLAPYNSMTNICEAALSSLRQDFGRAQEVMSGLPDELTEGPLKKAKDAIDLLSPQSNEQESHVFKNEDGDVCLGQGGWHQVPHIDEASFSLENLARGWLLHTRPSRRATQWTVMSVDGRPGALQVIKGHLTRRSDYYKRFKDEVTSLKELDHPSVLRVLDFGRTPAKDPYLVTEPLHGETLEERMAKGRLSPNEMKQLGSVLFESLQACHQKGIIHFNIHPCNIQFREDNSPVLTGFGVSCQELEVDESGNRCDPYASPEQRRGEKIGPETDIYSLGSILINSVGGINAIPKPWQPALNGFINPSPASRPSATEVVDVLQDFTAKYYVHLPKQSSKGPFDVSKVVDLIIDQTEDLIVQRVGSLSRNSWRDIFEIATRVEKAKELRQNMNDQPPEDIFKPESLSASINTPQPQKVLKAYEESTNDNSPKFIKDENLKGQDSLSIGDHLIPLTLEDGDLRSPYIRVQDALAVGESFDALTEDEHQFLNDLQAQSNTNGELAVSKVDATRFLKLVKNFLTKQGDSRGNKLSMMRAGGKGPFRLVIRG